MQWEKEAVPREGTRPMGRTARLQRSWGWVGEKPSGERAGVMGKKEAVPTEAGTARKS